MATEATRKAALLPGFNVFVLLKLFIDSPRRGLRLRVWRGPIVVTPASGRTRKSGEAANKRRTKGQKTKAEAMACLACASLALRRERQYSDFMKQPPSLYRFCFTIRLMIVIVRMIANSRIAAAEA